MDSNEHILHGPPFKNEFPRNGIGCMIFEACDKYAKKICHISPHLENLDKNCSETYASFKDRTSRVARELLERGLKSDDFLVNCCPNNFNNMLTTAACFYIGGIPATMDPSLSDRDCANLLQQMKPKYIFVHEASIKLIEDALDIAKLPTNPLMVVYGKHAKYLMFDTFLEKPANGFTPIPQTNLDSTAMMLFSSGSTGLAKGICITHRLLFAGALNFLELLDDPSCMLHYSTFYWISAVLVFIGQFIVGGCRVAAREFNDEEPSRTISKHKVTGVFLANSFAYQMQHSLDQQLKKYDISSLKTIIFAGGPVGDRQIKRIRACLPGVNVFIGYGMSEAGAFVTGFDAAAREKYANYASSCGLPLSGTEIKFVDPETEKTLGPNETGELRYKICGKFNGYYGHPNENTYDSNGFFKSGDLGYHNEEGLVYICDRIRDMFKYMCWHIVPVAIELIINEHVAVLESVVFGVPHEAAENLPAAAVVLRKGCKATSDELINFVAARTIDRHHLRGGVYIVDKLLKTPSGKVQRRKIKEMIITKALK